MDMDETVIDGRERGCVRRQTLSMRGAGMLFYFYTCFVLGVGADADAQPKPYQDTAAVSTVTALSWAPPRSG